MSKVRSLHSRIADDLLQKIRDSVFEDQLPTENVLAVQYRVSVPTVKKALGLLVADGAIQRIQGKGTFINQNEVSATDAEGSSLQTDARRVSEAGAQGASTHSEAAQDLPLSGGARAEGNPEERFVKG
ncbi:MAG: GntR family transcriptional regulator, partial [Bacilli bacterium]